MHLKAGFQTNCPASSASLLVVRAVTARFEPLRTLANMLLEDGMQSVAKVVTGKMKSA